MAFFQVFLFQFACYQVLSILHDKMGQNFSLGEHILAYFVKENGNFCSPWLYCIIVSKLSLGNLSLHNFWTKQIKGTSKSGLKSEPESI